VTRLVWQSLILGALCSLACFGQDKNQNKLSFSLYAWPSNQEMKIKRWVAEQSNKAKRLSKEKRHREAAFVLQGIQKYIQSFAQDLKKKGREEEATRILKLIAKDSTAKYSIVKNDPVPYLNKVQYSDGNQTHSVNLLPGRQSKRLFYGGTNPLELKSFMVEANSTRIVARLPVDAQKRDVLYILNYYNQESNSYQNVPVDRTRVSKIAGTGIVLNLSGKRALVSVNGITKELVHQQAAPFRMQGNSQAFTRFQVSVESADSEKGWALAHSSKRFLSKRPGTIFLLSLGNASGKPQIKVVPLSPPR